ncbi:acetyl-CoA synthetase [Desulfonema ishimotonii]|uniref:Acetyl-CoA synthetase n=1 Tax=Desulfonema ishimotonii TaxID=45657 RepID=A0A401FSF0_9BACT|nr:AMP-binding protein [Desulfonema ishimotonii]GBC59870.1 acetyl-CoA synthetase [Desulfonema ishimotonii]
MSTFVEKLRPESYDEFIEKFSISVPENFNFAYDVVDKRAAEDPKSPAMIHMDDDGKVSRYDFEFFKTASDRFANVLTQKGIGRGDKVMLILYRRVEFWVSMLALHKIGAVAIPSPNLLTAKDIAERVTFAEVRGVVAENSVVKNVEGAREKCTGLEVLIQVGGEDLRPDWADYDTLFAGADDHFEKPEDAPGGEDTLVVFFSSGTTGPPKMVEHVHNYPLGHINTALYWHNLEPGDIHLTLADTGWAKAVWGKFYGQWMAGAVIFVYDFRGAFKPAKLLEVLSECRVTTFCAPPTVYRFLIQEDLSGYDLSALRYCTTAGELLNESVFHTWKEATGLEIHEGYGQTETSLQVATYSFMEPRPGSIGKPVPGWDIRIMDPQDQPCPPGEEGEICINIRNSRPMGLFNGYYREPDKTADVMRDGYYRTGDKAYVDEDGYFWFLGRVDDLIKSSGYRIGPFEVESALITHPAIVETAVTGVPDPVRGQAVKATVVLAPGYAPSDALTRELQDHVKKTTAPYKYPRIIEYVEELPKTISGKIKRAEIRANDMKKMEK